MLRSEWVTLFADYGITIHNHIPISKTKDLSQLEFYSAQSQFQNIYNKK